MGASTLQSITAANNKAVSCLQENNHAEAISCLRHGLAELKQYVKEDDNDRMELDDDTPPSQATVRSIKIGIDDVLYAPDSIFCFIDHAFVLGSYDEHGIETTSIKNQTSAVLLYNMALVYHRAGVAKNCMLKFQRALRLYELVYSLLTGDSTESTDDSTCLVLLATINNMGHVQSLFFNFEGTRICRKNLRELLFCNPFAVEDELTDYLCNMIIFLDFEPQAAPAA